MVRWKVDARKLESQEKQTPGGRVCERICWVKKTIEQFTDFGWFWCFGVSWYVLVCFGCVVVVTWWPVWFVHCFFAWTKFAYFFLVERWLLIEQTTFWHHILGAGDVKRSKMVAQILPVSRSILCCSRSGLLTKYALGLLIGGFLHICICLAQLFRSSPSWAKQSVASLGRFAGSILLVLLLSIHCQVWPHDGHFLPFSLDKSHHSASPSGRLFVFLRYPLGTVNTLHQHPSSNYDGPLIDFAQETQLCEGSSLSNPLSHSVFGWSIIQHAATMFADVSSRGSYEQDDMLFWVVPSHLLF